MCGRRGNDPSRVASCPGRAHNYNNDRILKAYLNATWRNLCIASLHVNCFDNHFHVQLVRADLDLFGCPRFLLGGVRTRLLP